MNAATEFNIGPLTWVKSEIDLALERADQALQSYTESVMSGPGDLAQIKAGRTHLHQVHGALTLIGLDGVKQFTEALEAWLEAIERQLRPAGEEAITLAQTALQAIGHFLDDLIGGQPNQPLRLLPLYREIQKSRGIDKVSPSELFFPDLNVCPPQCATTVEPLEPAAMQQRLRQARARFQRGFLSWLKQPQERHGIDDMRAAVQAVEATQETASARTFWWVATGLLSALGEGAIADTAEVKPLCTRIDQQIRRLADGSQNVAERLLRDALFILASAVSTDSEVQAIQAAYRLDACTPDSEFALPDPREATRRKLRDVIAATEVAWNRFCAGTAPSLHRFAEQAAGLAAIVEQLGQTDYRRLAQAIVAAARWLVEAPTRHSDALATEVATALLLAQNAQENFAQLGSEFASQVDVTVARIHACMADNPPPPGSGIAQLDEMSREAQGKLQDQQAARDIQTHLAQIEQVLEAFFHAPGKRSELAGLSLPLRQITDALNRLQQPAAVAALTHSTAAIGRFSDPAYAPCETDFEEVASQLSLLGLFIDSMQYGTSDFASFVRQILPPDGTAADDRASEGSVEQDLETQKREAHALLGALKEQPHDDALRTELRQNLSALQKDADLVADATLGAQTKAMLNALDAGQTSAPEIDQAMASLQPVATAPAPSAETLQLSQASREEIDAELLGIFLEEANEVLATVTEHLAALKAQPHNPELLATLRRSFHTLKGSGRMVGLQEVGEAAWAIEQTLNLWLRQEQEVTPHLLELIDLALSVFSEWVAHLETPDRPAPNPATMITLAEALRRTDSIAEASAPAAPPACVPENTETQAAAAAPHSAEIITVDFGAGGSRSAEPTASPENPPARASAPSQTLHDIFREEAAGHLATLRREQALLEREEHGATPHEMYRAAHTLAGISAAVGLPTLNQIAHALENALLRRDLSAHPGSLEALGVLAQTISEIDLMLTALGDAQEPVLPIGLVESLDALYPPQLSPPETQASDSAAPDDEGEPSEPAAIAAPVAETAAEPVANTPSGPTVPPLRDEIDEQLLPIFIEEALDLIQGITAQLRLWREHPDDREAVRTLARLLHTLKGSARMAGAMNVGQMTHVIETQVGEASRTAQLPVETIDDINSAFDDIPLIIERLQWGETTPPSDAAVAFPDAADAAPRPAAVERRSDRTRLAEAENDADPAQQRASLRVRADLVDRLVNDAGELSIARTRIEGEMRSLKGSLLDLTDNVIRLRRQLREIEIQAESQMQSRNAQADDARADFDPLEFDRFTRFQELTRMMAESVNDVGSIQQNLLKNLDDANAAILAQARLNREMQQELMGVRMVPFGTLADRLYRVVRQTSKELNKRANLEISGDQLELDRSVLDKMSGPLEHLLRNAIAHGLESRETRTALGKPEIGEIALSLQQEGNEITLSLSDDGAGLDLERIRLRGVECGLIGADETADPARLADLIFTPGFSTAEHISQIAGRGIGMDVVKAEVVSLGGRIETISTPGQGTEFRLTIPLTLAVTKALLVRVGNRQYALPSAMVEQVLDLKEAGLAEIRDAGAAEWMGHRYPFNYLPHLLGEPQALPEQHRQYWTLLLRSSHRRLAVQVDELLGNREIVVKNIGPQLARVIGVEGATVLGDGRVVLIINPIALSLRAPAGGFVSPVPTAPTPGAEEAVRAHQPTVMVVDDSLTVRKITGRLLAREGYQVILAKDGVEALENLHDALPDVMLVDIEMPRLDGFDLTRNIRADARLKSIPIIMITSRTAEKHRNYAFEVGVDHFLGKPFQEDELLRLVAGYVSARRRA